MFRNFSTCHPIFKLLKEHLKFIIAVEIRGREVCFAPVGAGHLSLTTGLGSTGIIEILTKAYKDTMDLSGFYHRYDAIVLWDITFESVKSFFFYDWQ